MNWNQRALMCKYSNGFKCYRCGAFGGVLHAHHLRYPGNGPGDLVPLCPVCHRAVHLAGRQTELF